MALTKVGKEGITGISNSSDATAITIDSSENVGIGTASPARTLTVDGSGNRVASITHTAGAYAFATFSDANTSNDGSVRVGALTNDLVMFSGGAERMRISSDGEVTKPSQPAFLATIATQADVTGDGTSYGVSGSIFTEVYDKNSDFNNGTFNAPVTGTYHFCFLMTLTGIDASTHTSGGHTFVTSNRNIAFYNNPGADRSTSLGGNSFVFSTYIDMDANDTAFFQISVTGGTKVVDLFSTSVMSGVLVS